MKKSNFRELVSRFAYPVAMVILGLVLMVSPDTASVFVAKVLGYALLAVGAGLLIAAFTNPVGMTGRVLGAIAGFAIGGWLLRDPMVLARSAGRVVGLLLLIRGAQELFASNYKEGKLLSLLGMVLGVILMVLPLTTSRVVFTLCGVVVLIVGVCVFLERLRKGPDKPDIIDVDAL